VVCGSREFIAEATRWRKMLGAGMRQVGVLAAAGLVALDTMIERLAEDHANARVLAHGLARFDAIDLEPDLIQTNIVRFEVAPGRGNEIAAELRRAGVLINPGTSELRMVTHYGITAQDITATLEAMRAALATVGAEPVAVPVAG
jgi:threonine aldolase